MYLTLGTAIATRPHHWTTVARTLSLCFSRVRTSATEASRPLTATKQGLWSKEETDTLLQLLKGGQKYREIFRHFPDRTPSSIYSKISLVRREEQRPESPAADVNWWTTEDLEQLRNARLAGMKWAEIANLFPHRTFKSVRRRWYNISRLRDLPRAMEPWAEDEYDQIRVYRETHGMPWIDISDRLGRNPQTLRRYYSMEKIRIAAGEQPRPINPPTPKMLQIFPWTAEQKANVKRLWQEGLGVAAIARQMDVPRRRVRSLVDQLSSADPEGRQVRPPNPWTVEEDERIVAAVEAGREPEEIAVDLPNRSHVAVVARMKLAREFSRP